MHINTSDAAARLHCNERLKTNLVLHDRSVETTGTVWRTAVARNLLAGVLAGELIIIGDLLSACDWALGKNDDLGIAISSDDAGVAIGLDWYVHREKMRRRTPLPVIHDALTLQE